MAEAHAVTAVALLDLAGKVNEKGTEEMKKLYADYWLYAAASPEPRLLYSHDYAVHRKSYNTRPVDLYFKKCPEQHQRAVARMRARISHVRRSISC